MICSDGLTTMVDDDAILAAVEQHRERPPQRGEGARSRPRTGRAARTTSPSSCFEVAGGRGHAADARDRAAPSRRTAGRRGHALRRSRRRPRPRPSRPSSSTSGSTREPPPAARAAPAPLAAPAPDRRRPGRRSRGRGGLRRSRSGACRSAHFVGAPRRRPRRRLPGAAVRHHRRASTSTARST